MKTSRPAIHVTIGCLFEDLDVLDSVDFEASQEKFEAQLREKFAELAPGSEVEIDVDAECDGDNILTTMPRDKELERGLDHALDVLLNVEWEKWCVNQE
jgi:hypothetical protein